MFAGATISVHSDIIASAQHLRLSRLSGLEASKDLGCVCVCVCVLSDRVNADRFLSATREHGG